MTDEKIQDDQSAIYIDKDGIPYKSKEAWNAAQEAKEKHKAEIIKIEEKEELLRSGLSKKEIDSIILTTENNPQDLLVEKRIEIITAECVFGMNLFRDLFAAVRDIVGGRSVASQKVLRDARKKCLRELKIEAYAVGADAVIGVDLDYSEFSGGRKSMLFLVASGTAVKLKKE